MHEWSMVQGILETVKKRCGGKKISEMNLIVGELQAIDEDNVMFALKESPDSPLKESVIRLTKEKARFKCTGCGFEWKLEDEKKHMHEEIHDISHNPNLIYAFTRCPKCKSTKFEVLGGTQTWIKDIKVTK